MQNSDNHPDPDPPDNQTPREQCPPEQVRKRTFNSKMKPADKCFGSSEIVALLEKHRSYPKTQSLSQRKKQEPDIT